MIDRLNEIGPVRPAERPQIEHYARCSLRSGDFLIEPGIELRDEDDFDKLSSDLEWFARSIGLGMEAQPGRSRMAVCRSAAADAGQRWPGRAFFVEIHDAYLARWTQTYQPYGLPQNRNR